MTIKLPRDSKERIRVMLAVMRGETVRFEVDGVMHTLTPDNARPEPPKAYSWWQRFWETLRAYTVNEEPRF